MLCPRCSTNVSTHLQRCHVCGTDIGFPNVRAAQEAGEEAALDARLASAKIAARARGSLLALEGFSNAVAKSSAVLARSLGDLEAFVKSDNVLYVNFHSQVRARSRIPENNDWDKGRVAAESTVHPHYFEEINYTALSVDEFGVLWWGEYSIVLKEMHIATRTSVFEENPFLFCERHRVTAGKPAPLGYRATWARRQDLAVAKLANKVTGSTKSDQYAPILLHQGASRADADFIECHTFGPIHRTSIERVTGPRPKGGPDLVIWRSVVASLQKLGAIVQEV